MERFRSFVNSVAATLTSPTTKRVATGDKAGRRARNDGVADNRDATPRRPVTAGPARVESFDPRIRFGRIRGPATIRRLLD